VSSLAAVNVAVTHAFLWTILGFSFSARSLLPLTPPLRCRRWLHQVFSCDRVRPPHYPSPFFPTIDQRVAPPPPLRTTLFAPSHRASRFLLANRFSSARGNFSFLLLDVKFFSPSPRRDFFFSDRVLFSFPFSPPLAESSSFNWGTTVEYPTRAPFLPSFSAFPRLHRACLPRSTMTSSFHLPQRA